MWLGSTWVASTGTVITVSRELRSRTTMAVMILTVLAISWRLRGCLA